MKKAEYIKFLEAVDVVCVNCIQLSEEKCKHCPVRMTYDALNEKMEKQKRNQSHFLNILMFFMCHKLMELSRKLLNL